MLRYHFRYPFHVTENEDKASLALNMPIFGILIKTDVLSLHDMPRSCTLIQMIFFQSSYFFIEHSTLITFCREWNVHVNTWHWVPFPTQLKKIKIFILQIFCLHHLRLTKVFYTSTIVRNLKYFHRAREFQTINCHGSTWSSQQAIWLHCNFKV